MNNYIIEQAQKEYPLCHTILDKINYTIEKLSSSIEKISFNIDGGCPIYCLCDGRHMMWYGDHGSFTFDCTWQTSLKKIPFQSPHYLFEKLDRSGARGTGYIWNGKKAEKELLEDLYSSEWWEDLPDHSREVLKEFFEGSPWKCAWNLDLPDVDEDMIERIKECLNASHDEFEFASQLNELEDEDPLYIENLYNAGNEITPHFWFTLMCLNWIYDKELEKETMVND